MHALLAECRNAGHIGRLNSKGEPCSGEASPSFPSQGRVSVAAAASVPEPVGESFQTCTALHPEVKDFRLFGWNLGGCSPEFFHDTVKMAAGRPVLGTDLFVIQEAPRAAPEWDTSGLDWHLPLSAWTLGPAARAGGRGLLEGPPHGW